MDVGVKVGPADGPEVLEAAKQAESLGFGSVWLSERIVTPLDKPHPYDPMPDPWIALAYIAADTTRVRLGTSVSQIATRHPVLMARELATLDRLSQGRLIVGAGAGWVIEEFIATDIPFEDRGGRLSEHIQVLRHLWTSPETPWTGRYYHIPPVGIVRPATPGGPTIIAGALSDAGFRRVAKHCDGWTATSGTPEQIAAGTRKIAELRAKYGRAGHFAVWVQVAPPDDAVAARSLVESYRSAGATGLILTYPAGPHEGLRAGETAARALIEAAEAAS
jgi:probable F420-dependent oxidoreductase